MKHYLSTFLFLFCIVASVFADGNNKKSNQNISTKVGINKVTETLADPSISINRKNFNAVLNSGQSLTDTLWVRNLGNADLTINSFVSTIPELIYFRFDQPGDTLVKNEANSNTAVNTHGKVVGMTMGSSGVFGSALVGAGGFSDNFYVNSNWQPNFGTNSWTISMWLNNMYTEEDTKAVVNYFGTYNRIHAFCCYSKGDGSLTLDLGMIVSPVILKGVAPGPSQIDFIYDADVHEVRAYLNNVLKETVAIPELNIMCNTDLGIGGFLPYDEDFRDEDWGESFSMKKNELLDEFKIYNRAIDISIEKNTQSKISTSNGVSTATPLSWLSISAASGTVVSGDSMMIILNYNTDGLSHGNYKTQILINSNDPQHPRLSADVSLQNTGKGAISIYDTLKFETASVGATSSNVISIKNSGTRKLHVSNIISSNSIFTVDTTQFDVMPAKSFNVTVTFTPPQSGNYNGWIVVHSNVDADSFYVEGNAIPAPTAVVNQLTNPIQVNSNDSVDVVINIANNGGSPLEWKAMSLYKKLTVKELNDAPKNMATKPIEMQCKFNLTNNSGGYIDHRGGEFDGTYFYTTQHSLGKKCKIVKFDKAGNLVKTYHFDDITSCGDMAYDGTYIYLIGRSDGMSGIFKLDLRGDGKVIDKISVGSRFSPNHLAYDEDKDAFWTGQTYKTWYLYDRSGTKIDSIPYSVHNLDNSQGTAYDNYSPGGPYLWVFAGEEEPEIVKINLTTKKLEDDIYEIYEDFKSAIQAGGLWIGEGLIPGKVSLGAVCAWENPNWLAVYEIGDSGPSWLKAVQQSGTLAAGSSTNVTFRVHGKSDLSDSAYIAITTNDPNNQVINMQLVRKVVVGIDGKEPQLPTIFEVAQNYPNPFNPTTKIDFSIPKTSVVKIIIYNSIGEVVSTIINKKYNAGKHSVNFDGTNLSSGVYFYKLVADVKNIHSEANLSNNETSTATSYSTVKKMLLIK